MGEIRGIFDSSLIRAIVEIEQGLFEAKLCNGLYKKRIAKKGRGKRAGYRTLIAFKKNDRAIFIYGYAKNEKTNLNLKEEFIYKKLTAYYLALSDNQLNLLVKNGELFEVKCETQEKS